MIYPAYTDLNNAPQGFGVYSTNTYVIPITLTDEATGMPYNTTGWSLSQVQYATGTITTATNVATGTNWMNGSASTFTAALSGTQGLTLLQVFGAIVLGPAQTTAFDPVTQNGIVLLRLTYNFTTNGLAESRQERFFFRVFP